MTRSYALPARKARHCSLATTAAIGTKKKSFQNFRFFSIVAMSKRKALSAPVGVLGALKEVKLLERAGFIVDVDEANAKSWHIALEPKLLKQHGLGTLIDELKLWACTARKPVAIVLEVRFGDRHPFEPPFVRVLRPRFLARTRDM